MDQNFEGLKTLVAELRGRMPPNLTERQYQDIGMWMLKAFRLGHGDDIAAVFAMGPPRERPKLRLV